ncbi:MAG: CaiB/BaiF CoA-transferase family protein [Chloroflexota bacterium]
MAKALEDLTVLDLTQWEAGPQCTLICAFLGADVIKVEPPGVGDPARHFSTVPLAPDVDSFYFIYYNLNKKGITLDLDKAKGREILKEMVKKADILVENYEPGTMEKWGLTYDVLKEINPGLIYGRISGYGSYGPYADYPAVDATVQAMGGLFSWTGYPDKPPVKSAPSIGETASGVNLFDGIMMALHQKDRTGKGQFVECTMMDTVLNLARVRMSMPAENDQMYRGTPVKRAGVGGRGSAPSILYPTKDKDNLINFMFGRAQSQWDILLKVVGHPELVGDPRFVDPMTRGKHEEVVNKLISDWTSTKSGYEAFNTLAGAGVSTGVTLTTTQAMNDPHVIERQLVVELEHPVRGKFKTMGYAAKLEKSPVEVTNAPLLGQDNEKVYAKLLGYTKEDLAELKEAGVI